MMMGVLKPFLSVIILLPLVIQTQSNCRAKFENMLGHCVPLYECKAIANKIQRTPPPYSDDFKKSIAARQCGPNNKKIYVCCTEDEEKDSDFNEVYTVDTRFGADYIDHRNYHLLPTNEDECGHRSGDRVSKGFDAGLEEIPWMALLQYDTSDGIQGNCGGSLINNRYVLTAAHCITQSRNPLVSVRLGEYDTSAKLDCKYFQNRPTRCAPPTEDYSVEKYILHSNYSKYSNDIALIRLSEEVSLKNKSHIYPVCLPLVPEIQNKRIERFTLSGWGFTENGQRSAILQKGIISPKDNTACSNAFNIDLNDNTHLCAGGSNGTDQCSGDSGGPLFADVKLKKSRNFQFGIVSAGKVKCEGSVNILPGLYTRVTKYLNWILDNIEP